MSLFESLKDIAAIIATVIAFVTLIMGFCEYKRQGVQKRAEQFIEMRKRFKENETFREISALLENDSPKLAKVSYKNRRDFLGFFEEIALMVNSKLIRIDVGYYMFGYYIIKCAESENFWKDIDNKSQYWSLFNEFAKKMKDKEKTFEYSEKKFRF